MTHRLEDVLSHADIDWSSWPVFLPPHVHFLFIKGAVITHSDCVGLQSISVLVVGVGSQQRPSLLVLIVQTLETLEQFSKNSLSDRSVMMAASLT